MRVGAMYNMSMRRTYQLAGMEKGVHVLSQDSLLHLHRMPLWHGSLMQAVRCQVCMSAVFAAICAMSQVCKPHWHNNLSTDTAS